MTVLKYNHSSLLLIRVSQLGLPLLFVVSMVPWVRITLLRQHGERLKCFFTEVTNPAGFQWGWAHVPLCPPPSYDTDFCMGFSSFLEQEWGSLTHPPTLGTSHVLLSTSSRKQSCFYYAWKKVIPTLRRIVWGSFKSVQCHGCKKEPRLAAQMKRMVPTQLSPKYIFYPAGWQRHLQPSHRNTFLQTPHPEAYFDFFFLWKPNQTKPSSNLSGQRVRKWESNFN